MSLHEIKEAAEMLGITPEELNEMRGQNKIFGYRDGTTWKFKKEEIDRVLNQRLANEPRNEGSGIRLDETLSAASGGSALDSDLDQLVDVDELDLRVLEESSESILGDDDADRDPTASSTVIGRQDVPLAADDLLDVLDGDAPLSGISFGEETSVGLKKDGPSVHDLDFDLDELLEQEPATRPRDVSVSGDSQVELGTAGATPGDGSDMRIVDSSIRVDEPPARKAPSPEETGVLSASTGSSDDDLILDSDVSLDLSDDDLGIGLDHTPSDLGIGGGSELNLAPSDTGIQNKIDLDASTSDVSLDASGSGINLESPSDSGISLEQTPPEIVVGGDSLELGEGDLLDLDDGFGELDDATLQSGEDFLLTPVEAESFEESDSGSQVIALDSEEFGESGSTILDEAAAAGRKAAPDFAADAEGPGQEVLLAGAPAMQMVPETSYSVWNVLGLGLIALPLALSGLMMFDVVRHIWSWDEPYSLNSSLIEVLTGVFGR